MPSIQDSSFKAKHLFFEKVLLNLEIIFYVVQSAKIITFFIYFYFFCHLKLSSFNIYH